MILCDVRDSILRGILELFGGVYFLILSSYLLSYLST